MKMEREKLRVFIVTYSQYDNYGSRLQNFALCKVLYALGSEPVTLAVSDRRDKFIDYVKDIFSLLPTICNKQRVWKNEKKKRQIFADFNKKLALQAITYDDLYNLDFTNTIAIAGSDQIWSPTHIARRKKDAELYFLRFAPKDKRFAYAPSFGVESISDKLTEMYKEYISEFKSVSVREITGQKIIKKFVDVYVPVLPDPTFLLSKKEWIKLTNKSEVPKTDSKYILTYFLSKQNESLWTCINKYAAKKNFKVICISGNKYRIDDIIPTPDSFINLINDATAVFTDSFHGSVFSILMQTPFVVCKRSDVNQFSRIEMLLKKYKMTVAFWDGEQERRPFDTIFATENFAQTENIVSEEQRKGLEYLKETIQSQLKLKEVVK